MIITKESVQTDTQEMDFIAARDISYPQLDSGYSKLNWVREGRKVTVEKSNDQSSASLDQKDRERQSYLLERVAVFKDKTAFTELFEFFAPRLKSYMIRLGEQADKAEELAQDTMINVWRKAEQYDRHQATPSTWIFRIARNRRIDVARKNGKPPLDAKDPSLHPEPLPAPDTLADLSRMETDVRAAMKALPNEQAELLQAAYYEGLSQSEIADRLGIPLGTVKSRIRLAFGKLRTTLDGYSSV